MMIHMIALRKYEGDILNRSTPAGVSETQPKVLSGYLEKRLVKEESHDQ